MINLKKNLSHISIVQWFILISIAILVIFAVKYFGLKKEWRTIRVEVINKNWAENYNPNGYRTPFWLSDKLKIGQKETDKTGKAIAEVLDIENYVRGTEEAEVYLTLKVQTIHQKRQDKYIFKEKNIDLGSAIELNLNNIQVFGQIIDNDVPTTGYLTKTFTITSRSRSLEPAMIDKIKVGSKMYNRATSEPIAEIVDVKNEEASRIFINSITDNSLSFKYNPRAKDVIIKTKVKAIFVDHRWYFSGHQDLKVGNSFYLYTDKFNLYAGEIENVEE